MLELVRIDSFVLFGGRCIEYIHFLIFIFGGNDPLASKVETVSFSVFLLEQHH